MTSQMKMYGQLTPPGRMPRQDVLKNGCTKTGIIHWQNDSPVWIFTKITKKEGFLFIWYLGII